MRGPGSPLFREHQPEMIHPFSDLLKRSHKPARLVVGLMSGTSADSIDVAVCRMTGQGGEVAVELLHYREHPHDPEVKRRVLGIVGLDVRGVAELHVMIAEAFAAACLATLEEAGLSPQDIDLIGSHGQTVYHHSGVEGAIRATLQVGDGDVIAVRTGCSVVSDFRARDIAAGGEGAPLSPIADVVLFGGRAQDELRRRRAILNLGGIANLTVLDDDPARVFGFDTGPANSPLDRLARRLSGDALACDRDGRFARAGRVDESLLAELLEDDLFLARRPPKSTGFEMYGDAFVARVAERHGGFDADLMTTLTEFVARTIALGVGQCAQLGPPVEEVVAAGGGVKNPALMERIAATLAPVLIRRSDEFGVPSYAREAMAFAVMADMTLRGQAAYLPPVTGAAVPKLLGKVSFP
jgi:anhydro-N-acetylmuramic acid kinase